MEVDASLIPAFVVGGLVVLFGAATLVVLALQREDPAEVAVAYEQAWDRLDFDLLWRLSGPALRDGRTREEFVRAKREAYGDRADVVGLVKRVRVDRVDTVGDRARVVTELELHDGSRMRNELRMLRMGGRWLVDVYRLGRAEV